MTAPKTVPAKSTSAPAKNEAPVAKEETPKSRIPNILEQNPILVDFCNKYLGTFDEISEYNKNVLAEKDATWNASKILEKSREFARPTDKNTKPVGEIKTLVEKYESLVDELAKARKAVIERTSQELGITTSAIADRDPAVESSLKEKRKVAIEIGTQLTAISGMLTDKSSADAIKEFLDGFPLPAIGRDQVRTFGTDGKSTPKYRVTVKIMKGDEVLLEENGFTKTALQLTNSVFGYERGKALKSDDLRAAWEKVGNTPENTVVSPVEFEDNGLKYSISKKN